MTDINTTLVEYLIEDHRRLANRDLPATTVRDYEATIAQMEPTMQGWEKITTEREERDTATIKALTEEVERWRASNQRLTQNLNAARAAAPTEVARWVNDAFALWDEDPDKAFKALGRAHQALTGAGKEAA